MVGEESAFSFLMGSTRANADRNVKGWRATAHAILSQSLGKICEIGYSATTRTNRRPSIFPARDYRIALSGSNQSNSLSCFGLRRADRIDLCIYQGLQGRHG